MKSLVEEASSVVKAIEKAWNRAGNPQTFSVKVFETPETNFFGFTKKSAKVGIFFEEEAPQPARKHANTRDTRSQNRPTRGRETTTPRNTDTERAPRTQSRQARPQSTPRPTTGQVPVAAPRQEQSNRQEAAPAPRNRDEQRSPRPYEQRTKRPERAPRERQGFVAEPTHEHDLPLHEEYMHDTYAERQEQFHQQAPTPPMHQERHEEGLPHSERRPGGRRDDSRSERRTSDDSRGERRADDSRYERRDEGRGERRDDNRGDRRDSRDGRRDGRNDRNGRNGRPQRAQRHEFDEQREMVNLPESHDFSSQNSPETTHSAPVIAPTLVPVKKVLKVSGRRYSAPAKPDKDNE